MTAPTGSDALRALRDAVEAAGRVRRALARRSGLGDTELAAVQHLMAEPLGPAELARRLDLTPAAATGLVDRLAARGHVERRPHAADRRRTTVQVTGSGQREVLELLAPMLQGLAELDAGFTEAERAVVARYLDGARRVFASAAGD